MWISFADMLHIRIASLEEICESSIKAVISKSVLCPLLQMTNDKGRPSRNISQIKTLNGIAMG